VVLAAETGSGKTLAYLAPVVEQLLVARDATLAAEDANGECRRTPAALILCPNAALCQQVHSSGSI
jgi:superfamily II DNA/RNA helicase